MLCSAWRGGGRAGPPRRTPAAGGRSRAALCRLCAGARGVDPASPVAGGVFAGVGEASHAGPSGAPRGRLPRAGAPPSWGPLGYLCARVWLRTRPGAGGAPRGSWGAWRRLPVGRGSAPLSAPLAALSVHGRPGPRRLVPASLAHAPPERSRWGVDAAVYCALSSGGRRRPVLPRLRVALSPCLRSRPCARMPTANNGLPTNTSST